MSVAVTVVTPLVVAAAVLLFAAVLVTTRELLVALPVLLDLLLVAGLLRLSADASWSALGAAALTVLIRKVAMSGLRRRAVPSHAPGPAA